MIHGAAGEAKGATNASATRGGWVGARGVAGRGGWVGGWGGGGGFLRCSWYWPSQQCSQVGSCATSSCLPGVLQKGEGGGLPHA